MSLPVSVTYTTNFLAAMEPNTPIDLYLSLLRVSNGLAVSFLEETGYNDTNSSSVHFLPELSYVRFLSKEIHFFGSMFGDYIMDPICVSTLYIVWIDTACPRCGPAFSRRDGPEVAREVYCTWVVKLCVCHALRAQTAKHDHYLMCYRLSLG